MHTKDLAPLGAKLGSGTIADPGKGDCALTGRRSKETTASYKYHAPVGRRDKQCYVALPTLCCTSNLHSLFFCLPLEGGQLFLAGDAKIHLEQSASKLRIHEALIRFFQGRFGFVQKVGLSVRKADER